MGAAWTHWSAPTRCSIWCPRAATRIILDSAWSGSAIMTVTMGAALQTRVGRTGHGWRRRQIRRAHAMQRRQAHEHFTLLPGRKGMRRQLWAPGVELEAAWRGDCRLDHPGRRAGIVAQVP